MFVRLLKFFVYDDRSVTTKKLMKYHLNNTQCHIHKANTLDRSVKEDRVWNKCLEIMKKDNRINSYFVALPITDFYNKRIWVYYNFRIHDYF